MGIPVQRKQHTYSFSWKLYMIAVARDHTYKGIYSVPQSSRSESHYRKATNTHIHTHTHTIPQTRRHAQSSLRRESSLSVYISSLECFTASDWLSCINSCQRDLNPYTWSPHFTTPRSEMFGVIMSPRLSLSVCTVYSMCWRQECGEKEDIISCRVSVPVSLWNIFPVL